ncbi:MAG: AAA family ATPase [Pseudomonadota bacterium]
MSDVRAEPGAAASAGAVTLIAAGAAPGDADRAVARLDPADLARLGARAGDLLKLSGVGADRATYARALPAHAQSRGASIILLDEIQRANAGVGLGEPVAVATASARPAETLVLSLSAGAPRATEALAGRIRNAMEDTPAALGDRVRIRLLGGVTIEAIIAEAAPEGPLLVTAATRLGLRADPTAAKARPGSRGYAGIAGLDRELAQVREMVELPLRRPDLFQRLGVDAPKGVLFSGPPGCGKTLLARAVAEETEAAFFQLTGPEIVSKHYGDSESRLRELFKSAEAKAPSVIFIDEIDAIAPKRANMAEDRQLERRVVAQLLGLMDGLSARGRVIVMAATNLPDALDPALRRPGRFDREIAFSPPDRAGRAAILRVHAERMPLSDRVEIDAVAAAAHGYVGADLAALAREAGLAALRRLGEDAAPDNVAVEPEDFDAALKTVGPSALREVAIETPETRWSDVGGAAEAKRALVEAVIWPLRHEAAYRAIGLKPAKGVLLAGPPGTGKTHLARALAHEAGVNFIPVRGAELLSRFLGDAERGVRELFRKARASAPCILFFDEIDALAPVRGESDHGAIGRVTAQLLTEIDGVDELRGVTLLAATNRPSAVDPALLRPGRFDLTLEIGAPDAAARAEILAIHAADLPRADDVALDRVAESLEGWVGADLKALCEIAGRSAIRRWIEAGANADAPPRAVPDDFDAAAAELSASRTASGRAPAAARPLERMSMGAGREAVEARDPTVRDSNVRDPNARDSGVRRSI